MKNKEVKRGWKVEARDAVGIAGLSLIVILVRSLFAPAPIVLPSLTEIEEGSFLGERAESSQEKRVGIASPIGDQWVSLQVIEQVVEGGELFRFDPNTLDADGFVRLGFSAAQSQSILRYRASGALFRKPEDFARSYVVSDQMYSRLAPYIQIELPQSEQFESRKMPFLNLQSTGSNTSERVVAETETKNRLEAASSSANSFQDTQDNATFASQREHIEINSADTSQLKKLRGIGSYYAKKIVQYRDRLGGFVSMEQLMEIDGIDTDRFEMMAPQIEIDFAMVRTINLLTSDQATLSNHPYIGAYSARWIVHYRQQLGDTVCTLPSLVRRNIIKEQHRKWLEYYVE